MKRFIFIDSGSCFRPVRNDKKMVNERKIFSQGGQIALIVILVMVVVGTIALSVASRSVTDVSISEQEEEKIRAFSAAEAGIEDLLSEGLIATAGFEEGEVGDIKYKYKIEEIGGGSAGYELDSPLGKGETIGVGLYDDYVANPDKIELFWTNTTDNTSLEVSFFIKNGANYGVERHAYNAYNFPRDNGMTNADSNTSFKTETFSSYKLISVPPYTKFIRIKALYNQTLLAVKPSNKTLPPQAYKVRVEASEGESTAALEVVQAIEVQAAQAPVFDYTLWSGGGITK